MADEGEAERGVTADAIQTLVCDGSASPMLPEHRLASSVDLRLPET
jgi:hypothetical protein